MIDTVRRYLSQVASQRDKEALRFILDPIADRLSTQTTSSAGLVIKAGGGVLAKTGTTAYQGVVQGKSVTIATGTDMPALTGTITASSFNVYCFFIDSNSTVTLAVGTEATTLKNVEFPPFPVGKALVGYLIITHSSTFTGNTTPLDTATTNYVSPIGPFDPSVLVS